MNEGYEIKKHVPRDNIPVVKGFQDGESIMVWCPFCRCFHSHGVRDGREIMQGHRVAHCHKDTPFKATGYYIRLFTTMEKEGKGKRY